MEVRGYSRGGPMDQLLRRIERGVKITDTDTSETWDINGECWVKVFDRRGVLVEVRQKHSR